MAYNYDKQWLDKQSDFIGELVEAANRQGELVYEFETFGDLQNHRIYVRNVLAGLAFHYPHYVDVAESLRTWKEIDRSTGSIMLHVGTLNNFRAQPRVTKTRQGKTHTDQKLRGAHPSLMMPPVPSPTQQPAVNQEPDIFDYNDIVITSDNMMEIVPGIIQVAQLRNSQLVRIKKIDLSTEIVKVMLETLDGWTLDDSTESNDRITSLTLRRRGEEQ